MRTTVFRALALIGTAFILSGCAGPSTFVSSEPPPETAADAWFLSGIPAVRAAVRQAMIDHGVTLDAAKSGPTVLVGSKEQLPYVDEETGEPAAGPLPVYVVRAAISRPGDTHVRLQVRAECGACDGETPYVWEYPSDLIRAILEETRTALHERHPRIVYPPRYRPPRWRRRP